MFCVIQEIRLKKPNIHGAWREYEVTDTHITMNGGTMHHYGYYPVDDAGKFERLHREAYRLLLHFSFRQDGKPRKRQYALCTVNWYDFATGCFSLYDWAGSRIERVAEAEGMDIDQIYNIVEEKISPLEKEIQKQYHKTEEYKSEQAREKLLKDYQKRRKEFAKQYGQPEAVYDNIFDIHGVLREPDYLDRLIQERKQEEERQREQWSSYYSQHQRTYSSGGFASAGGYTEADRIHLKEFYRLLSRKFHPDLNPDRDTTEAMKLINRLKEDWKL